MVAKAVIKISGDAGEFFSEIDKIKKQSENLNASLSSIATKGAVAFAAFTAGIAGSIATFRVQEQALLRQEAVLKSTGFAAGLTSIELQKMASGLQAITTFGDEAIIQGQNLLLTFKNIGQDVFPQTNKVMLDVATAMGQDLKSTAIQLGKALNDPTTGLTALSRVGITFTNQQKETIKALQAGGEAAKAQKIILAELESQFGGAAEAAAKGTGSFIQLSNVFGDIVEDIGAQFVPLLSEAAKGLTQFLIKVKENGSAVQVLARLLAAGAGIAGFITAAATGTLVISKMVTAFKILTLTLKVGKLAAAGFTGALTLGLGFVIAFLPEIIQFTKDVVNAFNDATEEILGGFGRLAQNLLGIGSKLGDFFKSLFSFDFAEIGKATNILKDAINKTIDETFDDVKKVKQKVELEADVRQQKEVDETFAGEERLNKQKQIAVKTKAIQQQEQDDKRNVQLAGINQRAALNEAELANNIDFSIKEKEEIVKLKMQEIEAINELESAVTEEDRARAEEKLVEITEQGEARRTELINQKILERDEELALQEEFRALDDEDRALVNEKELENLNSQEIARREALIQNSKKNRAQKKSGNAQRVSDEVKHGKVVATIQAALRSSQVQGVKSATGDLVELQNSRNSKLKSIGKAAAVTQILIKGAESAINVFNGFSTIPIIGPALGIAGAAAAIAFSIEKANVVRRAQLGGVVPGAGSGDIIPAFLEPGEIVVPKALSPSFEEQFSLDADPDAPGGRNITEVNFGTIIGSEEFVNENVIPIIRDAREFNNAFI